VDDLPVVTTADEIAALIAFAGQVHVAPPVLDYIVDVVAATRSAVGVRLGASPRASVALLRATRSRAAAAGRAYVTPTDVKDLAVSVLAHRIVLTPEAELRDQSATDVVTEALAGVPAPAIAAPAR
jgi:MoxR-like ATPase